MINFDDSYSVILCGWTISYKNGLRNILKRVTSVNPIICYSIKNVYNFFSRVKKLPLSDLIVHIKLATLYRDVRFFADTSHNVCVQSAPIIYLQRIKKEKKEIIQKDYLLLSWCVLCRHQLVSRGLGGSNNTNQTIIVTLFTKTATQRSRHAR